jgi:DUF4097 and DUF4098 domain-containing protein YvlB
MTLRRLVLGIISVIVVCVGAFAVPAQAKEIDKDLHESFTVKPGDRLLLLHGDGDVTVTSWDQDVLDVAVRYRVSYTRVGFGGKPDFEVEFQQNDDTVRIIGKEKGAITVGFITQKQYEYSYTIRAPSYLELDLKGDDGDVSIQGWDGPISCDSEDGDITLEGIRSPATEIALEDGDLQAEGLAGQVSIAGEDGDVTLVNCQPERCRIELEDGDITVRDCEGSFALWCEDGDIEMRHTRVHVIEVETADGDVELDLLGVPDLDAEISSDNGNISIELERGFSIMFSIEVEDGTLRLDLPDAEILQQDDEGASGAMHGGRGRLNIRTADGRVALREKG